MYGSDIVPSILTTGVALLLHLQPDSCVIDGECYTGSVCTACEDSIDIGHPKRSSAYKTGDNEDALCDASLIEQGIQRACLTHLKRHKYAGIQLQGGQ